LEGAKGSVHMTQHCIPQTTIRQTGKAGSGIGC